MHMPTIPRPEFKGKSGQGDWADCLLELDADFGAILDTLKELQVEDNTIIVFSGDNGPEEMEPWRGHSGFFDGSYFTGMEGSLRTPCLVRFPGRVPSGRQTTRSFTSPICSPRCCHGPAQQFQEIAKLTAWISEPSLKAGKMAQPEKASPTGWGRRCTA